MDVALNTGPRVAPTSVERKPDAQAGAAPPTPVKPVEITAGPATKVTISDDARGRMRAAGVNPADMAAVNVKDSGAVSKAIRTARAGHVGKRPASPAAAAYTATPQAPPQLSKVA
jgi:hypothetical protein